MQSLNRRGAQRVVVTQGSGPVWITTGGKSVRPRIWRARATAIIAGSSASAVPLASAARMVTAIRFLRFSMLALRCQKVAMRWTTQYIATVPMA